MNFFIETIGCQMNVNDSEKIALFLLEHGCCSVDNIEQADIVILNTCSVRFSAEHKAYSFLGRVKEYKQQNPDMIVAVVGCMAQYAYKEIKQRFDFVNFVLGAKHIDEFSKYISKYIDISSSSDITIQNKENQFFKFVTIMRGCQNFCSYCIVPYVRGPEISLDFEDIINEINNLVQNGVKEVTLLGQNVNSYKNKEVNFTNLLQKISAETDIENIRFMTNHPKDLSDDLIDEISNNSKICKHIHLPLQSGSDNILKNMNRKYTYDHYRNLVDKIRNKIPDINITTDIIVGFPGETDNDFDKTFQAIKQIKFGGIFGFKYSPRPKTLAYKLQDDVSETVKKQRLAILLEESNKISKQLNGNYIGKTADILVENFSNDTADGRNSQNIKIFFKYSKNIVGQKVKVKITKALANSMTGEIIV
ncbi:tRNA (N6-isopentenyl adenosine(37)-C2)-methylthiotransferase MiaB [Candidatus Ruminimicrobium bovinum]|uniref:tRNA (N6-isopentenyl adenosine(37)-C2)-methylthiotransferase MiaB n=1 Tax=Candidatus Ruminimicrobium bovinum TaxID=3242779 RepID=UPI0039B8F971